jgi:hypothetical protein
MYEKSLRSVFFKQQRYKLLLTDIPITILIDFIKYFLNLLVSLGSPIKKCLHFLNRYKSRVICIQIVESVFQSLLLKHFFFVTSSHQELCEIDSS